MYFFSFVKVVPLDLTPRIVHTKCSHDGWVGGLKKRVQDSYLRGKADVTANSGYFHIHLHPPLAFNSAYMILLFFENKIYLIIIILFF